VSFVPLHVLSGFSYLHSGLVVERIPLLAKKLGYDAVGLSDTGTLSGYAPFTHEATKLGVKPIYGMDAIVQEGTYSLYVLNEIGYRHLLRLTLLASEKKLTLEDIRKNADGLSIVYSLDSSFVHDDYHRDQKEVAALLAERLRGLPSVSLGIPYLPQDAEFVAFVRAFASSHSYPTIAFPRIVYEKKSDAIVLEITEAIFASQTLEKKEKDGFEFFLTAADIESYYSPEEIEATEKLAAKSDFAFLIKRGTLLHFENDKSLTSEQYLRKIAVDGLEKRVPSHGRDYDERLDYELAIIGKMGYADYFLIVADYVHYAKTHGVSVGPGRGSAAGSLVSFALGIVASDPLKYNLLFERFLNPERQSMPDIDVDFSDTHRDIVVQYIFSKYGTERVGHVLTTQTIGAKQALRDIGRVYDYEDREIELIIDAIVNDKISLREDYKSSPQFKKLVDSDKYYLQIVALASKIEGLPRQAGLHAAGLVLNEEPLPNVMPVMDEEGVGYVACLEKDYLEEQGFLKMDILGLRNLTIVDNCLALIKNNESITLAYDDVPYEDKDSIALIAKGKTVGVFQVESPGMKKAIEEIRPTDFEDIVAILALFRPGPMESIPSYARRKHGEEKINYLSPELEKILAPTYGIIVYQEQIMQIVRTMAGFSYGEADLFRRAISKKDAVKLAALKESFLQGCAANKHSKELSERVFDLIYKFADYGFNRSHSLSYAVLTCQMAYLKKHYPKEFYAAILDSMSPEDGKFKDAIAEIKEISLRLAVPGVNSSESGFAIKGDALLFPLNAIKSLPGNLTNGILDERNLHGKYLDLFDFAARVKTYGLSLPTLVKLIDAGALDELWSSRSSLRATAPAAMSYAELIFGEDGQQALLNLGIEKPAMVSQKDDFRDNLNAEYAALGIMVSGSPLSLYRDKLKDYKITSLSELSDSVGEVLTIGIVKDIRAIVTRKGSQMAFLSLYDDVSEIDSMVLFSEAYATSYKALKNNNVVLVKCRRDMRKDGAYLVSEAKQIGE
jgi:DNA polymerase III subunit alpha